MAGPALQRRACQSANLPAQIRVAEDRGVEGGRVGRAGAGAGRRVGVE